MLLKYTYNMSSGTSSNQALKICGKCGNRIELKTSRTDKNPNRKFWRCGCGFVCWADDQQTNEGKLAALINNLNDLLRQIAQLLMNLEASQQHTMRIAAIEEELHRKRHTRMLAFNIMCVIVLCLVIKVCYI